MHIALQGALIGALVAIVMFVADYLIIRANALQRARRSAKKPELEGAERRRMATLLRYCFFVPPAFALFFWLIWA